VSPENIALYEGGLSDQQGVQATMKTVVSNRLGQTIRRSRNLRGLLLHYKAKPEDLVIKVTEAEGGHYDVTFYWPHSGDQARTQWADWRVLLDWLLSRRSWSIDRVTFDAPLYDRVKHEGQFDAFRKSGIYLTRHAYARK
jgi:hypothetical protein